MDIIPELQEILDNLGDLSIIWLLERELEQSLSTIAIRSTTIKNRITFTPHISSPASDGSVKWCSAHNEDTAEVAGEWIPIDAFNKDKGKRDGLAAICRVCDSRRKKQWRAENHDYDMAKKKKWAKDNPERTYQIKRKWQDEKHPAYYIANRETLLANKRQWAADNPEMVKAYSKQYYIDHREELLENKKIYLAAHPDYTRNYYQANKAHITEAGSRWKRENKDRANTATHRRRARVKGLPGSHTTHEWLALLAAYDYHCADCGRHQDACGTLERDHIIPTIFPELGSTNSIDNLQPLCRTCNARKAHSISNLDRYLEERALIALDLDAA